MKRKLLSAFLAAAMLCIAAISAVSAAAVPAVQNISDAPLAQASVDETSVYNAIIAMKDEYPDGMEWTNDNYYGWNGGIYAGGFGCAGFAFMLSDTAFGSLPARMTETFDSSIFRVGDILRYSSHSVIVLQVHEDSVIVAEGNINSSIMWGREITFAEMESTFEHHLTRYPAEEEETTEPSETETTESFEVSEVEFWLEITLPDKTEYYIGEELDLSGMEASVGYVITYWNGQTEYYSYSVPVEDLEIIGFSSGLGITGTNVINVAYEDEIPYVGVARMENSFTVTVMAQTTTTETTAVTETTMTETTVATTETIYDAEFYVRLEVASEPDKTEYLVGEELDLTGLTVNTWFTVCGEWIEWLTDAYVTDFTNTKEEYIEIAGYDPDTLGEQGISVTLSKYNSVLDTWVVSTDCFYVTVLEEGAIADAGLGDVDLNGIVNATDAGEVLVAAAAIGAGGDSGLNEAQTANADVDGNGVLDAVDAAWILRYAAYIGAGGEATMEEFFAQNS